MKSGSTRRLTTQIQMVSAVPQAVPVKDPTLREQIEDLHGTLGYMENNIASIEDSLGLSAENVLQGSPADGSGITYGVGDAQRRARNILNRLQQISQRL